MHDRRESHQSQAFREPFQSGRLQSVVIPTDETLLHASFTGNQVSLPKTLDTYPVGSLFVRAVADANGTMLQVFDAPRSAPNLVNAQGALREIVPQVRAATRSDLSAAAQFVG